MPTDTKFFRVPFAQEGDMEPVPDALQPSGYVSFQTGYGFDYERDQTSDPAAKEIERLKMNWMFNQLTAALRQYQTTGTYPYITPEENNGTAYPYAKGAQCLYQGAVYESLEDNNTTLPTTAAKWRNKSEASLEYLPADVQVKTTAPLTGGGSLKSGLTLGINPATETVAGAVARATDAEASAGTDKVKYVTAYQLATATAANAVKIATDEEAAAGKITTKAVNPKQLGTAIKQGWHTSFLPAPSFNWPDLISARPESLHTIGWPLWRLAKGQGHYIQSITTLPRSWDGKALRFRLHWFTGANIAAGTIVFRVGMTFQQAGSVKKTREFMLDTTTTTTATGADSLFIVTDFPELPVNVDSSLPTSILLYVQRLGGQAPDNFAGDALFAGLEILYAVNKGDDS